MFSPAETTALVKKLALASGFSFCGISRAEFLEEDARRLEKWLKDGKHGEMGYMENHFEKRTNPVLLVPGAKSVISLMYNYFPSDESPSKGKAKVSRYAYGEDYHQVIKEKLFDLTAQLKAEVGDIQGRVFVDSAPVLERTWAAKSGLGWVGKNAMLISKTSGSYFFLAEIISDLNLVADGPIKDYCGTCTACIDACPTDAILPQKEIDSNKCISYLTIELRNEIPVQFKSKMENWVFGCDICQEVCPWNRFSKPHHENRFLPGSWMTEERSAWIEMTEEIFQKRFGKSAISRTGWEGLQRNLRFLDLN